MLGALVALVLACGPSAAPAATPAPPAPRAESTAGATAGGGDWEPAWNALVEAARREGKVVVHGPPTAAVRTALPPAFHDRFGIELEYLGGPSGDAAIQLESERQAGIYSTDAILAGADTMYGPIYEGGMLDPLRPALIHPDALDASHWPGGKLWFADPGGEYVLRINNSLSQQIYVNTDQVKPEAIRSWYDLLRPEYQGRIVTFDPSISGAGLATASYLYKVLGADYVRRLYVDQKPMFSRDHRQSADWLARGQYPIAVALREVEFAQIQKDGFPVAPVPQPPDAPGHVSAGFGLLGLMNNAPHPNAARVFVNWIAGPEGMAVWSKAQGIVPVRSDLDASYALDAVPDPNVTNYFDSFEWNFVLTERAQIMKDLRALIR
ncbi:MAG TPA: extracellular solute-binding protein [Chloroflexota bacterium]